MRPNARFEALVDAETGAPLLPAIEARLAAAARAVEATEPAHVRAITAELVGIMEAAGLPHLVPKVPAMVRNGAP